MWISIPSTVSPFAQEVAGSTLESGWQSQALASSVWWRGKPSLAPIWSRRCEKVSWMRRLSGQMPEPSRAADGVASWMASLAASRVSLTPSPDCERAATMSETYGARRGASSSNPAHGGCSSKTSAGCSQALTQTSDPARSAYGETYAGWVSRLREDCSRRQRLARRTSESASSFSAWPTPLASDDGQKVTATSSQRQLLHVAAAWSTPRASDGEKGGPNQSFGAGGQPLTSQAAQWPTPRTITGGAESAQRKQELGRTASGGRGSASGGDIVADGPIWPPRPNDAEGWRRLLAQHPQVEPALCGNAHGLASRVDELRLLGNGVVPLEAAYAVRTLATRLADRGAAGAKRLVRLIDLAA